MWPMSAVAGMCGTSELPSTEFKIIETSVKRNLVFESWSVWAQENCVNADENQNANDDSAYQSHATDSTTSTLHHSKAPLYGTCPAQDEFLAVKCKQCGILLKPVAHRAHMNYRHNVLLKSPDVGGQFTWTSVISPPPPSESTATVVVMPCVATTSSSTATAMPSATNFSNERADADIPVVVTSNVEIGDKAASNVFDKFGIANNRVCSKSSGNSTVKLKKPKPAVLRKSSLTKMGQTSAAIASLTSANSFANSKEKALATRRENYVVTHQSDHRLKITISKKALKEQPIAVSSTKWTIPKLGRCAKKDLDEYNDPVAVNLNADIKPITRYEHIDVNEFIDYYVPTTTSDGVAPSSNVSLKLEERRLLSNDLPYANIVDVGGDSASSSLSQAQSSLYSLYDESKQKKRRISFDRNNNATHPKPLAICSFGARHLAAKSYVFNRKQDFIRKAFESALDDRYGEKAKAYSSTSKSLTSNVPFVKLSEPPTVTCSDDIFVGGETVVDYPSATDGFSVNNNSGNNTTATGGTPVNGTGGTWCKMTTSQNGTTTRPVTVSVVPQDLLAQLLNSNNNNNSNNNGLSTTSSVPSGYSTTTTATSASQREKPPNATTINLSNATISYNNFALNASASAGHLDRAKYFASSPATSTCYSISSTGGRGGVVTAMKNNRKRVDAVSNAAYACGGGNNTRVAAGVAVTKRARNSNLEIGPYSTAINRDFQVINRKTMTSASIGVGGHRHYPPMKNLLNRTSTPIGIGGCRQQISTPSSVVQRLLQQNQGSSPAVLTLPPNAVILDGNKIYTVQNGPSGPQFVESGVTDTTNLHNVLNEGRVYSSSSATVASTLTLTTTTTAGTFNRAIQPKVVAGEVQQQQQQQQITSGSGASFVVQIAKVQNGLVTVTPQLQQTPNQYRQSGHAQTVIASTSHLDSSATNGATANTATTNVSTLQHQQQPWVVNVRSPAIKDQSIRDVRTVRLLDTARVGRQNSHDRMSLTAESATARCPEAVQTRMVAGRRDHNSAEHLQSIARSKDDVTDRFIY